jgi:outer membrane protein TolC
MGIAARRVVAAWFVAALSFWTAPFAAAQAWRALVFPEQRTIAVRDPADLPRIPIPDAPPPATVSDLQDDLPTVEISLDEAIRIGLANSEVVRVLAGVSAVSSGRTIYDAAITNTLNDQERARFDPTLNGSSTWNRDETPGLTDPPLEIGGERLDNYHFDLGLSQQNATGGTLGLGVSADALSRDPFRLPLDPQLSSSLDLSYTQPLLQGGGLAANLTPLVLARIDTERSYFQFKDSVQELVRGVIEAYWALVFARTDRWARLRQVEQAEFAYRLARARFEVGSRDVRDEAQARVSLQNFQSSLLAAQDNVLQREAALRNILGLPPTDGRHLVPTSPPSSQHYEPVWEELLQLAELRRPDLIELKLILEADQQRLLQVRNQANPRVDATAIYRWNGLEGELDTGQRLATRPGQFTDWTLGINFSVPLGLRQERARLRQQELIIARDRANLQQGLHSVIHLLAQDVRNLQLFYNRYTLASEIRVSALQNLEAQLGRYRTGGIAAGADGQTPFISVLLAITDWGNAISSEAQFLAQYNTQLANLERDTGTILETHGVFFCEERFGGVGPWGRLHHPQCYPEAVCPSPNADRYQSSDRPAEEYFDLQKPLESTRSSRRTPGEQLPPPLDRLPAPRADDVR